MTSIDQISLAQLEEQVALLTQCRQKPAKVAQFQQLPAGINNRQPTASSLAQTTATI